MSYFERNPGTYIVARKIEYANHGDRLAFDDLKRKALSNSDKRAAIKAAKDLLYGPEVISQLEKAETNIEINKIMSLARKRTLDE